MNRSSRIRPWTILSVSGACVTGLEFQHIIAVEVPDIPLYSPLYLTIHNVRVHDHSMTADGVEANMALVWLDG